MAVASLASMAGKLMGSLLPSDASRGASAAFSLTETMSICEPSRLSRKSLLPCRVMTISQE